jgi:capsular polysaccharide biosynthesis protein
LRRKSTEGFCKRPGQEFTIDFRLYIDVLRRHRLLVLSGFVVALALALLSYVRVSPDGLTYRNPEIWSNEATLILSAPSHPELRSELPPTADPNRFTNLVEQYAEFATSDAVMSSLRKQHLVSRKSEKSGAATITATPVASLINGAITPLLKITGMATSPLAATRLTIRATDTFIDVARTDQIQAKVPESQRVELRIVKRAEVPKLVGPRSKTTFIIILLAGLTLTVGAAFLRENLQREASPMREADTASVFDRLGQEAQPQTSTGSEHVRAAPEHGSGAETNEAAGGVSEARSVVRTHRRASSSG